MSAFESSDHGGGAGGGLSDPVEVARVRLDRAASVVSLLESVHRRVVGALLEAWPTSAWRVSGCVSPKQWLVAYTSLCDTDAQRLLSIVRLCVRDDRIAEVVLDGRISIGQAAVLARVVTVERHRFLTDEVLDALVRVAQQGRPADFGTAVGFWVDHADQEISPTAPPAHGVYLSPRLFGGGEIHGALAPGAFERVAAGIDAFLPDPDPVGVPWRRTLGERRADALDDLASFALTHDPEVDGAASAGEPSDADESSDAVADGDSGAVDGVDAPGVAVDTPDADDAPEADPDDVEGADTEIVGGVDDDHVGGDGVPAWERDGWRARRAKPRSGVCVNVTIDLQSFLGIRPPEDLDDLVRHGDGWALTQRAVEELACDAALVATLFAGRTRVLDANTRAEQFSKAQRRALAARDQGCVFPGCGRSPRHCDAHHLEERSRGGPTTVDNGVLLCRFHHRLIHRDRWRLQLVQPDDSGGSDGPAASWIAIDRHGIAWKGRPTHQNAA